MPLSRGEIILVQFPYSSGAGSKLRPAVVVQPDFNNRRLTNVILAPITTTIQPAGESTQYLVDAGSSAGKAAGLRHHLDPFFGPDWSRIRVQCSLAVIR